MKKLIYGAIFLLALDACYTPLNNSGVATTKRWLDIPAKKTDFEGKQYDSCYQFNLRFWPQDAADTLDLRQSCISACCWRSDKETVTLDFNKNFDRDLAQTGRAKKYTPGKITLTVKHSNLLNTTKVSVEPKGAVTSDGLVKLKYKEYENPARLAQVAAEARKLQARRNAEQIEKLQQQPRGVSPSSNLKKELNKAQKLAKTQLSGVVDTYFYQMDKTARQNGQTFMISKRIFSAREDGTGNYYVTCRAKTKTGVPGKLTDKTESCGVWKVDLHTGEVSPANSQARKIWNGK